MIARVWHGYTSVENANSYENFLKTEFMPSVEKKKIPGYKRFQLLKKEKLMKLHLLPSCGLIASRK